MLEQERQMMMDIEYSTSSLQLWSIANAEAWFCQGAVIEPAHFWVGCLKMTDPKLVAALVKSGAPAEECQEFAAEAERILTYLEMDAEAAATKRREMRAKLLRGRSPREFPEGRLPMLHRSESSRRLFELTARKATERGAKAVTPMHLLESLFEMELVSLDSL